MSDVRHVVRGLLVRILLQFAHCTGTFEHAPSNDCMNGIIMSLTFLNRSFAKFAMLDLVAWCPHPRLAIVRALCASRVHRTI